MKTRPKDFDCVRMKNQIQRELMAAQAGMELAERQRDMEDRILADPILGPWFQRMKTPPRCELGVAETSSPYRVANGRDIGEDGKPCSRPVEKPDS